MKKILLLLLAPLLMATQCESEEDPVFSTEFVIQNNSSTDLILITEESVEVLIESQSRQFIAVATGTSSFVLPSENIAFDNVSLYRKDNTDNLILVYKQIPIVDELWNLTKLSSYDSEYVLVLTDDLID